MQKTTNEIIERAQKIYALADRGIQGERESAKRRLKEYVNKHPDILGGMYPNYLSKANKGRGAANNSDNNTCETLEELYERLGFEIWENISLSELMILNAIAANMGISPDSLTLFSAGLARGRITAYMRGKHSLVSLLNYRFHIYRKDFAAYVDNLTYSYLAVNGLAKGNSTPDTITPFYKTCTKSITELKF